MKRWFAIAGRVLVIVVGLVVLAVVGRVAAARAAVASVGELDAAVVAPPEPFDAAPPPPSLPPSPPLTVPAATAARATPDDPVFVNYASAEQLRRLPGVGVKRAEAIVALRGKMGRFQRVEDLLRVKGIGRATLKKLRPLLRLDAQPQADAGTP